ncbi:hypothetical protein HUW51_16435 [Adhaeribacter swui]|uniref:Uncharacterized protein n=1 Tax=Adhaeribacter swui TaxID=2086471 RepID=A0A7G7GAP6_9BACT|nr:hypothetical protein [Adhaeribacter swui]QNF34230.1 hypothetical protein HUW51_16435 [Adhaeribacter swui]
MRPELEEIKTLEGFIKGTLPPDKTQDVQIRLLWNQTWQAGLHQQNVAYWAIQAAGRQQLRAELNAIHNRLFP